MKPSQFNGILAVLWLLAANTAPREGLATFAYVSATVCFCLSIAASIWGDEDTKERK